MVALSAENKRNIRIAIIAVFTIALLVAVPLSAILNTRSNTSRKSGGVDNYDLQPYGNGMSLLSGTKYCLLTITDPSTLKQQILTI